MHPEQKAVRRVSWDLAEGVLKQIDPDALRFDKTDVEQVAFPREAYLGELDEDLVLLATVLRAAAQALTAVEGEEVLSSATPRNVADVLVKRVKGEIPHRAKTGPEEVGAALGTYLRERPSTIDAIIEMFLSPSVKECNSDILRRCVLKVTDHKGRISTGFALCPHGHVLTAEHVVRDLNRVNVAFRYRGKTGEKKELPTQATTVFSDRERDTAVLEVQGWEDLQHAGLTPPPLSMKWQSRDWVFCLGYQEQEIFVDPFTVEAFVKHPDPLLTVGFRDGFEQECLVLVIPRDYPAVVPGMSGGPILNQHTCQVAGMVTGATRDAWIRHRWQNDYIWELISSARYGFATPLSDIRESWPDFEQCCLASKPSRGEHQ